MADDYQETKINRLELINSRLTTGLTFTVIALLICLGLYISMSNKSNQQYTMIDTCSKEISDLGSSLTDASDSISSMNDSFDSISNDASDATWADYETQGTTLDDISATASSAQDTNDYTPPDTQCTQVDSGSN